MILMRLKQEKQLRQQRRREEKMNVDDEKLNELNNKKPSSKLLEPKITHYTVNPIKKISTRNKMRLQEFLESQSDRIGYIPESDTLEVHLFDPDEKENIIIAAFTKYEIPAIYTQGSCFRKELWTKITNNEHILDLSQGLKQNLQNDNNDNNNNNNNKNNKKELTPLNKYRRDRRKASMEELNHKLTLERKGKVWTNGRWEFIRSKYVDDNLMKLQLDKHAKELEELRNIIEKQQPSFSPQGYIQGPQMTLWHKQFKQFHNTSDFNKCYKVLELLWKNCGSHQMRTLRLTDVKISTVQNGTQYGVKIAINMNSEKMQKINWTKFVLDIPNYIYINNTSVKATYHSPRITYNNFSTAILNVPSNIRNARNEYQINYIQEGCHRMFKDLIILNLCWDLIVKNHNAIRTSIDNLLHLYYGEIEGSKKFIKQQRLKMENVENDYLKTDGRAYCKYVFNTICTNPDIPLDPPPFISKIQFDQWVHLFSPQKSIRSISKSFRDVYKTSITKDNNINKKLMIIHWENINPKCILGEKIKNIPRPKLIISNIRLEHHIISLDPTQIYINEMKICNACSLYGHFAQECVQLANYVKSQGLEIESAARSKGWDIQEIQRRKKNIVRKKCNKCSCWGHTNRKCISSFFICNSCGGGHTTTRNIRVCKAAETIATCLNKVIKMKERGLYKKGMNTKDVILFKLNKNDEKQKESSSSIPTSLRSEIPQLSIPQINIINPSLNNKQNKNIISISSSNISNTAPITLNVLHEDDTKNDNNNNSIRNRGNSLINTNNLSLPNAPTPSSRSPSPDIIINDRNNNKNRMKSTQLNHSRVKVPNNSNKKQRGRQKYKGPKPAPKPARSLSPLRSRSRSKSGIPLEKQLSISSDDNKHNMNKNDNKDKNNKTNFDYNFMDDDDEDEDNDTNMPQLPQ